MDDGFVLAIDQGTSATKCVLLDQHGTVVARASAPVGISYPRHGWVEQSAEDIVDSVLTAARACLRDHDPHRLAAVGLSNQRESVVLWDSDTGRPLGPVLGWQDRRTTALCESMRGEGRADRVRELSGLPLDPMFSALKVRWLLDAYDPDRRRSRAGRLRLGTIDTWLVQRLTGRYRAEAGNAARTQLLDIQKADWSPELLEIFDIPRELLPDVCPSADDYGMVSGTSTALDGAVLHAVLGDSHAALYAHGGNAEHAAKVTYGTGASVMCLTQDPGQVTGPVCLTIAWADPALRLAAEGNIRSAGATVAWLARLLKLTPGELADLASSADNGGVQLVPAFGGLAAPWWDDSAVGLISGLTLSTGPEHLARAALESMALQVHDVVEAVSPTAHISHLVADGGASANDTLMQIQADLSGLPVWRARTPELSALGAARLAGRNAGLWSGDEISAQMTYDEFHPSYTSDSAAALVAWRTAVARSRFPGPLQDR